MWHVMYLLCTVAPTLMPAWLSAMQPVGDIIPATLAVSKLQIDPEGCKLMLGKQQLDLNTPFRFANIFASTKLVIVTGEWTLLARY